MLYKLQHSTKIWSHTTHRLMPLNIDSLYLVAALWKQWNQTLSIIWTSSDKWAARSQCFFHFLQMATDSTVQSSKQINSYRIVVITLLRLKFKNTASICMNLSCVLCWYECLRFRYSFHNINYTTELNQHKRSTLEILYTNCSCFLSTEKVLISQINCCVSFSYFIRFHSFQFKFWEQISLVESVYARAYPQWTLAVFVCLFAFYLSWCSFSLA